MMNNSPGSNFMTHRDIFREEKVWQPNPIPQFLVPTPATITGGNSQFIHAQINFYKFLGLQRDENDNTHQKFMPLWVLKTVPMGYIHK